LVELFDVFDLDNSGTVNLEDFIEGVTMLALDGVSFTDLRLLRLVTRLRVGQEQQLNELLYIRNKIHSVGERIKNEKAWSGDGCSRRV